MFQRRSARSCYANSITVQACSVESDTETHRFREKRPLDGGAQRQVDCLMQVVLEDVNSLITKDTPFSYAKQWWIKLRKVYTYWKYRARAERRDKEILLMLEQQV